MEHDLGGIVRRMVSLKAWQTYPREMNSGIL
jgi:hypothetical protein